MPRSHYMADNAPRGRWVIAHRGDSGTYPENTMCAFRAAVDLNADVIELDVQLTSDGEVVVMHDRELGRTVPGSGAVAECSWASLRALDAGVWKGERFAGEHMPLLAQVFDEIALPVMVEIKPEGRGVVERTVDVIRECGAVDRAIIASFSDANLRDAAELLPDCERLALGKPEASRYDGFHIAAPHFPDVTSEVVDGVHQRGRAFWCWTVDDPADIDATIAFGADGIISNEPGRVIAALA